MKKARSLSLFLIFLFSLNLKAQYNQLWLRTIVKDGNINTSIQTVWNNALHTDKSGNIYLSGNFNDSASVGGISISPYGLQDIYVAKTDKYGNPLWVRTQGGWANDFAGNVVTDSKGNVYTCGSFYQDAEIDSITLVDSVGFVAIVKYSPDGNILWAKKIAALDDNPSPKMQVDNDGNIYLETNYSAFAVIDTFKFLEPGNSLGQISLFCKLDSNGNLKWVHTLGKKGASCTISDMQLDKKGDVYLTGIAFPKVNFGKDSINTPGYAEYLVKYSPDGREEWLVQNFAYYNFGMEALAVDSSGTSYLAGSWGSDILRKDTTGNFRSEIPFVARYSSKGNLSWVKSIYYPVTGMSLDSGKINITGYFMGQFLLGRFHYRSKPHTGYSYLASLDTSGSILLATQGPKTIKYNTVREYPGMSLVATQFSKRLLLVMNSDVSGVVFSTYGYANGFYGVIYEDANGNGKYDSLDYARPDLPVHIQSTNDYFFTNEKGNYFTYSDTGYETLEPLLPKYGISFSPSSVTRYFGDVSGMAYHSDFILSSVRHNDLSTDVSTFRDIARANESVSLLITSRNLGDVISDGYINFTFDGLFKPDSIVPSALNYSYNSLKWSFKNLRPFHTMQFYVRFKVGTAVERHKHYYFRANISSSEHDTDVTNDTCSVFIEGITPHDPNEKTVSPSTPDIPLNTEKLTYTVHFQNTGNDTAFNVIVRDTLDKNLDPETFRMISTSHLCKYSISKGVLICNFENIRLTDTATDYEKSLGFFKYSMSLKKGLSAGTTIKNTAAIYFDYNDPVLTNTVRSMLTDSTSGTGINSYNSPFVTLNLHPNPFSDFTTISLDNRTDDPLQYILYDMQGREVRNKEIRSNEIRIDKGSLHPGMYFILLHNNKSGLIGKAKLIVE